mmetsp:Transcript_32367/g.102931  ORF Transcript_32367/g.102931 Transcript_32367/m.102931 type:complete len:260 (+) Transcript_32367:1110-1889(+)
MCSGFSQDFLDFSFQLPQLDAVHLIIELLLQALHSRARHLRHVLLELLAQVPQSSHRGLGKELFFQAPQGISRRPRHLPRAPVRVLCLGEELLYHLDLFFLHANLRRVLGLAPHVLHFLLHVQDQVAADALRGLVDLPLEFDKSPDVLEEHHIRDLGLVLEAEGRSARADSIVHIWLQFFRQLVEVVRQQLRVLQILGEPRDKHRVVAEGLHIVVQLIGLRLLVIAEAQEQQHQQGGHHRIHDRHLDRQSLPLLKILVV